MRGLIVSPYVREGSRLSYDRKWQARSEYPSERPDIPVRIENTAAGAYGSFDAGLFFAFLSGGPISAYIGWLILYGSGCIVPADDRRACRVPFDPETAAFEKRFFRKRLFHACAGARDMQ